MKARGVPEISRPETSGEESSSAVFTSVTRSHLASARVLMESVGRHMPGWERFMLLADEVDGRFDPQAEPFRVLEARDCEIPDFRSLAFRYGPMELCCALKPSGFRYLLEDRGFERVLYLDSDIRLYRPLAEATRALEGHDIVLTPHVAEPPGWEDGERGEERFLRDGAYNGGFVAMRRSGASLDFVRWWCSAVELGCVVDRRRGLMWDQKWLDLVPAMFPSCRLLRHPGYNAAYWNLPNRPLSGSPEEGLRAGGEPLAFFHFSFYRPDRRALPFGEGGPRREELGGPLLRLLEDYRRRLLDAGREECRRWPYSYACFSDGTPIHGAFRADYRRRLRRGQQAEPENPFDADGQVMGRLLNRWRDSMWISAVAALYPHLIRAGAPHAEVPLHHQKDFAEWCVENSEELGLGDRFVLAQRKLLAELAASDEPENLPAPPRDMPALASPDYFAFRLMAWQYRDLFAEKRNLERNFAELERSYNYIMNKPVVRAYRYLKSLPGRLAPGRRRTGREEP